MTIAYLTSLFPCHTETFVLSEVDAHDQAGESVLTLSCDPAPRGMPLSELARTWRERTVSPPSVFARLAAVIRETVSRPRAMLDNVAWLLGLFFVNVVEFALAIKEFGAAAYFAPACRAHGTELIHVHFASRCLSAGIMLGRFIDRPVSCTVHAHELWSRPGCTGPSLRYRFNDCSLIATISRFNVDRIRRKCGDAVADRCHVVHCGVDLSKFTGGERQPVPGRIVLISALREIKGHRFLVSACKILAERRVPYECILIGAGPERDAIQRQIERAALQETVRLMGPMANDRLRPYLDGAAVFALPAVVVPGGERDGIPVALMEAMACGVPVVSTSVAGIPELLHDGEAGLLIPPRDAVALADALERILTDADLASRLSAAGRKVVADEFDIRKTTARLRELFEDVVETTRGLRPRACELEPAR